MIRMHNMRRVIQKALRQPVYAARVFARRAAAYISYGSGSGASSLPEAITLFLTYRCNLRCRMCGQWGEGGVTKKDGTGAHSDMDTSTALSLIDRVASFRPNITLFGGEPLLHKGCMEIIRHIKSKRMHCLMITNGSMVEPVAEELVKSGLDELNVSLDGKGELHDGIRGLSGAYERIMKGIAKVNEAKARLGRKSPLVNIQCTINEHNYKRLDEMPEVAGEARANSLTFHNLIFTDRKVMERQRACDEALGCDSRGWEGFIFDSHIDPRVLYDKISTILKGRYGFAVDFYPNFSKKALEEYYEKSDYLPGEYRPRCMSPWIAAYVFPDGEVRPCLNCSYSFGNVSSAGFESVWNSEAARRYRMSLKKAGIFPACARCTELYRY